MVTIKSKREIELMREACKVVALTYKELEERICPCEQHDYIGIKKDFILLNYGDVKTRIKYKCKRCGKEIVKID